MAKHKKKHSKKDGVGDDLLDAAAMSIKKYRKVTNEIGKLSTGQKLVGGVMLLAAGYFYLDKVRNDGPDTLLAGLSGLLPGGASPHPANDEDDEETPPPAPPRAALPRKASKKTKAAKSPGTFGRKPAASPDDDL
ncbi:hypothetical protein [Hymenobacter chitinivorans]|uniref:Uncharacterized protein n=1 Tax=Hymenobacter chitinivorans DSM 11115 TaxID=1121954 RepID=A0A2M9B5P8_9BACT|nr:hypothetical protein [Hymenobacter chitinivorans]PJJ53271.1 hypothetical protein CLV45_3931 [Hymenobacter chitinivorans DSM 11115]